MAFQNTIVAFQDTIVAIATAAVPAQGSVGIVRLSGPEALSVAQTLFRPAGKPRWESHRVLYGTLQDEQGQAIDEALLLWMQAPRSYTREDVVEFHCHGGIMAVQAVLQACLKQGVRLATAGEFTLRAFLNGRIDLTQAEGIADLVGAQSPQAAEIALAGIQGKLAQPIRALRARCVNVLAEVEARIDFADDLPPLDEADVQREIEAVRTEIAALLATAARGELLRRGLKVAIVGRPNVGKSSLLNAWSGCDRAIVTEIPGTTRDVVESHLVVEGMPVEVLDTAGIRETADRVEAMGIERSRQAAQAADLIILVMAAPDGWTAADGEIYAHIQNRPILIATNKTDLAPAESVSLPPEIHCHRAIATQLQADPERVTASIRQLERAILELVLGGALTANQLDTAINQRQQAALLRSQSALNRVAETVAGDLPLDFWTIDLREAIQSLGEITGEDITESVLDRIFSQFCIGK